MDALDEGRTVRPDKAHAGTLIYWDGRWNYYNKEGTGIVPIKASAWGCRLGKSPDVVDGVVRDILDNSYPPHFFAFTMLFLKWGWDGRMT
jgi:hypothetical protein